MDIVDSLPDVERHEIMDMLSWRNQGTRTIHGRLFVLGVDFEEIVHHRRQGCLCYKVAPVKKKVAR